MGKSPCLVVNGGFEGGRTATRKSRHRPAHARDAGSVRAALRCSHRYPLKVLADAPEWEKPDILFNLALAQERAGEVAAERATYQQAAQHFQRQLDKVARDS